MINLNKNFWVNLPGILIVFFLPFSLSIPNIIIPFGIVAIVYKKVSKESFYFKPIVPFCLFFLAILFSLLLKNILIEDSKMLLRIGLVLIAAVIILNTTKKLIVKAFILSINLALALSIFKILNYIHLNGALDLSNGEVIYNVLPIERPYFGFLVLISSLLTFEIFQKNEMNKKLLVSIILINVLFVFFIASRLTIITYILVFILYFFKYLEMKLTYKAFILSLILALSFGLLSINGNFMNRLKLDQGIKTFVDYEPRFVIWPCAVNVLKEDFSKLIIGPLGFESGTNALKVCYSSSIEKLDKREWYLERGFNAHNQFLGILIISGIFGLIFFIYFLFQLYKSAENSFVYLSILLGLSLFFILECIIYRQIGCYIVGLIIALVSKKNE